MDERRQSMMKRLADRHEKRVLQKQNAPVVSTNIDLSATEKAFLSTAASELDMKTPVRNRIAPMNSDSPVLSFDEKADRQILALSTWCNTMLDLEESEELDLGSSKKEACQRIQTMLRTKKITEEEKSAKKSNYHKIFEKNDSRQIRQKCRKLLQDAGIEESISQMLSKNAMAVRTELTIYSDLALQTSLLRMFLSFHPAWLKAALEAVFNTQIETSPNRLVSQLSRFIIERVFTNTELLKNKKYAQGSGKPLITLAGKEALHRHFLLCTMKIMFLIERGHMEQIIPNVSRMFTKSSAFKCLDEMFAEMSKEILSGSSLPMKKAFSRVGFTSSYQQSFYDNYCYEAKNFEDFSNGIILAKLIEAVSGLKHGTLLSRLRDPAGDRIRKLKNVEVVLSEMQKIGIETEGVTAAQIVGSKKEAVLSILWSIIGVRVTEGKVVKKRRQTENSENSKNKTSDRRRSDVHDDLEVYALNLCRSYGRELEVEVPDLESVLDGHLLSKAWNIYIPVSYPVHFYGGETMWEKVVDMAEKEMRIARGIHNHLPLFVKMFFERLHVIRMWNEKAATIQRAWKSYLFRNKTPPKMYEVVKQAMSVFMCGSSRESIASFNDATFTISRDSIVSLSDGNATFKVPKTPRRSMLPTDLLRSQPRESRVVEQVIEEEDENETSDAKDSFKDQDAPTDDDDIEVTYESLKNSKLDSKDVIFEGNAVRRDSDVVILDYEKPPESADANPAEIPEVVAQLVQVSSSSKADGLLSEDVPAESEGQKELSEDKIVANFDRDVELFSQSMTSERMKSMIESVQLDSSYVPEYDFGEDLYCGMVSGNPSDNIDPVLVAGEKLEDREAMDTDVPISSGSKLLVDENRAETSEAPHDQNEMSKKLQMDMLSAFSSIPDEKIKNLWDQLELDPSIEKEYDYEEDVYCGKVSVNPASCSDANQAVVDRARDELEAQETADDDGGAKMALVFDSMTSERIGSLADDLRVDSSYEPEYDFEEDELLGAASGKSKNASEDVPDVGEEVEIPVEVPNEKLAVGEAQQILEHDDVTEFDVEPSDSQFHKAKSEKDDEVARRKREIEENAAKMIEMTTARTLQIIQEAQRGQDEFYQSRDGKRKEEEKEVITTPELREILRAKRRICAEQKKISDKLSRYERDLTSIEPSSLKIDLDQAMCETETSGEPTESVKSEVRTEEEVIDRTTAGHEDSKKCVPNVMKVFNSPDLTQVVNEKVDEAEVVVKSSLQEGFVASERVKESVEIMEDERHQKIVRAVVTIQRIFRGYWVRRDMRVQIDEMQQRVLEYNLAVAQDDENYDMAVMVQTSDETRSQTVVGGIGNSAEMKLRKHTIYGLSDANLGVVLLSATIIDRLTALVPGLVDSFVLKYRGVEQTLAIFEVADRGYAYTHILEPLARILRRVVQEKNFEKFNEAIRAILPRLSPKLMHLMLAHYGNEQLFINLTVVLTSIARCYPTDCHLKKIEYFIKKSRERLRDKTKCLMSLAVLEKACSHI